MPFTTIEHLRTWYTIKGQGKPLVLLHGWGGSSESMAGLQELLSEHYQVLALDLPGFGQTEKPPVAWNVKSYQQFVLDFVASFDIKKFSLAGHSFGGRIAILLAATRPDISEKLVLIASAGIKHQPSTTERLAATFAHIGKRVAALPGVKKIEDPSRALLYRLLGRTDYYQAEGVMKQTMQKVVALDLTSYLKKISAPTLIIWGDKDALTPVEDAHTMHKLIPQSQLHIIKGASHYLVRRNAQELANHINQFLS